MPTLLFIESNKGLYILSDMIEISHYHFLAIMLSLSFSNWKMKGSHPLPKGEKSKLNLVVASILSSPTYPLTSFRSTFPESF